MRVIVSTLFVALTLTAAAGAETTGGATIAVADRNPATIRGTGFGARERVLVTVTSGLLRTSQRTVATYRGTFVVRFAALRLSPCGGETVIATGRQGSIARLKLSLRECPVPEPLPQVVPTGRA